MNEFYLGLIVGTAFVIVIDLIYYAKYLNQLSKFKKKEEQMIERLNGWFKENNK